MSSKFDTFRALHQSDNLFVLPNAWDARSALLFQEQQFPAVATSSAAVAGSLGYEDGEGMPFHEYLFVIKRILSTVQIPVSVDMEMGYGASDEEILHNVRTLAKLGIAGINLEDSLINTSGRVLKDADAFARTIAFLKHNLLHEKLQIFINVRCDTFILDVNNKQEETIHRIKKYEMAGADGIFLPCISAEDDIELAVSHSPLPLNVMCIPGLPGFDTLNKLGVKRASMGPFFFSKVYDNAIHLSREIVTGKSFSPVI
ncbi:isocitrate lyase/PEP mutase family protein [Chitinophaga sp. 22321]|uniref:Isocitrate lyase/phosphoenolpyruvate mutase family protein n=1 Tax=Chitinophaga hostae TaxID=2831022 RepID=A0ABS5IU81_9BACT|nr:isocitrate lyase/phosphoenolpyruvate mutase family protein [Chitinophaga hostae]MBS0026461.1 isocitrate lyase/phosphoenolpyruvate mutase family protein [Chitinophaga hostae]